MPWGNRRKIVVKGQTYYIVNAVRKVQGARVLVAWKGFSARYDSWEPLAEIKHTVAYKAYLEQQQHTSVMLQTLPMKVRGRKPLRAVGALLMLKTATEALTDEAQTQPQTQGQHTLLWMRASTPDDTGSSS